MDDFNIKSRIKHNAINNCLKCDYVKFCDKKKINVQILPPVSIYPAWETNGSASIYKCLKHIYAVIAKATAAAITYWNAPIINHILTARCCSNVGCERCVAAFVPLPLWSYGFAFLWSDRFMIGPMVNNYYFSEYSICFAHTHKPLLHALKKWKWLIKIKIFVVNTYMVVNINGRN